MKRFAATAILLAFVFTAPGYGASDVIVIDNARHVVTAKDNGDSMTFILEAIGDSTNNLKGTFPALDFASIKVDTNKNGRVDEDVDISYGISSGSYDRICTQLLISETSSKGCGSFKSRASMKVGFIATKNHPTPHPVWEFFIPKKEISQKLDSAHMVFRFHEAGRGYTRYPATKQANIIFSQVQEVSMTPAKFQVIPGLVKIDKPAAILQDVLVAAQPALQPGTWKKIIDNERHVVSAKSTGKNITFLMEAVGDSTNNLQGTFPNLDFAGIKVDINQNGRVDENSDISFGKASGSYDKVCTQLLISESSSQGCNSFKSRSRLKVDFKSTTNQSTPHPVWEFTIPRKEISADLNTAHMVFRFHEAGRGYTRYPATKQANVVFSETVELNVKTLAVTGPQAEDPAEDTVTQTRDNQPPIVTISTPKIEPSGRAHTEVGTVEIRGIASDESGVFEVLINGEPASVSAQGEFWRNVRLAFGDNLVSIEALDMKDNRAQTEFTIVRGSTADEDDSRGSVDVTPPPQIPDSELGNFHALLIAVENYTNPDYTDLDQPVSDATQLRDVLVQQYRFEPANVTLLEDPDEEQILGSLGQLRNKVSDRDNVLIFFAGHGLWDEQIEQGYWLPRDATGTSAKWISNGDIRDAIRGIQSKHTLLISDACFSGGLFKTREAFTGASQAIEQLYAMKSRKAMTSGTLTVVPDRSEFLRYLTLRLEENTDIWITANQLFASLRQAVMNNSPNTPQYGTIHQAGDEGGEFVFVRRQ